jgi:hypothetical protein
MAIKSTVLFSDLQSPFHDVRATNALASFIQWYQPHNVVSAGDEIDLPQISRWEKGRGGEHTGDLDEHRNVTIKLLKRLEVQHITRSNHSDRLYNKLASDAIGLLALPELSIQGFLHLKELGITYHTKGYNVAPGWSVLHGDDGPVSQVAGQTALGLAKRSGFSIACGHTHRAGLTHHTVGLNGKTKTLWGLELGNWMDLRYARYIKSGLFTWNQAFGILHQDGNNVYPQLIPVINRSFSYNGKVWKW